MTTQPSNVKPQDSSDNNRFINRLLVVIIVVIIIAVVSIIAGLFFLKGVETGSGDKTPPTVTIHTPVSGQTIFNPFKLINVSGSASDNAAIANVKVRLNNGTWLNATGTTEWSVTITNVPDGRQYIEAQAWDTSNNPSSIASVIVNYYYYLDLDYLRITISGGSFTDKLKSDEPAMVTITAIGTDGKPLANVDISLNGPNVNDAGKTDTKGEWTTTVTAHLDPNYQRGEVVVEGRYSPTGKKWTGVITVIRT